MADQATAARRNPAASIVALRQALAAIVGAGQVRDDAATLALHGQDIWAAGAEPVALVVTPRTVSEISRVAAAVQQAGHAIAPRGGGMSYTSGYVATEAGTVSLDLSQMDRVLAINADDMTVTVHAGCTWAALHQALAPQGLRTPFWGPMSGLKSTVGGGLSQLNAMLGAGHYGTSSESVVGLTVVLADGRVLRTGVRSKDSGVDADSPFYRFFGPDLTGLFCGDCGAFGIKAEITLRLIRTPAHEGHASFSFKSGAALLAAMAEMARAGIASEMCAFDPGLTRVRMQRQSLAGDLKTLGAVVSQQKSLVKGLMAAGKIALAGRDFVADDDYPLHVMAEGRSATGVAEDIAQARRIALAGGGREIENTIAKVIRAQPFPPLNSVLGPGGERYAPVHGIASLTTAPRLFEALEALFDEMAGAFAEAGVTIGYLFSSLSTNALIVEPVFYWPEAHGPVHATAMQPEHLARLPVLPANPKATAVVASARARVIEACLALGCGHFQIGRDYPYRASRDAASWQLIEAVKHALDPAYRLNPGVLGLAPTPVQQTPQHQQEPL